MSSKTLAALAMACAILSVVGAIWAAVELARTENAVPLLLVGPLGMTTGALVLLANRKKQEEKR